MRIGIDARFFGSVGKGLGRYTQKLIENLEEIDSVNDYFIFLRKDNFNKYHPQNKRFKKVLADYQWYTFSEQINMPIILRKYKLDLVHFPHFNIPIFYRGKFIITIHDLILLHFPTVRGTTLNFLFYWIKFFIYRLVIKYAIKKSEKIIAVSQFTKNDILENYEISQNKIEITHEACEDFCFFSSEKNPGNVLRKYGIIKPYVLYVGNAYPHKNLERLVIAFAEILKNNSNVKLVLVGKEDYFYNRLKSLVVNKKIENIIFSGFIPDDDLDLIYKEASLYVFPSLYEGFGLPPLEAMSKGVPAVSSDASCMREILGEAAYYFDATDVKEISQAVNVVLNDDKLKKELSLKGYERVKIFSWKEMAKKTFEIYKNFQP